MKTSIKSAILLITCFMLSSCSSAKKDPGTDPEAIRSSGLTFDAREDIRADFDRICAISLETTRLAKSKTYQKNKASLIKHVNQRVQKEMKTVTLKRLYEVISTVERERKLETWYQAAKENFYEEWQCPTIDQI